MYQKPKSLFSLIVLALLGGFATLIMYAIFYDIGGTMATVGMIVYIIVLLIMLFLLVLSIMYVVKMLSTEKDTESLIMHYVNLGLSIIVFGGYLLLFIDLYL